MDWSWLSTNSSLLTIRSGQENSWPNAHADLNNVLSSIENAWNFLDTDNDTDYDAIQKDMVECENPDDDCLTVPEVIDEIRNILNNHFEVELDFGDCEWVCNNYDCWDECTEDIVNITVDIHPSNHNYYKPIRNLQNLILLQNDYSVYFVFHL
jgi:hypothetical protein